MTINVMIIDDNETDRYCMRRWLRGCSVETVVAEAGDGVEALEYFQQAQTAMNDGYPPSIIFLDINMPRKNGFEFLEDFAEARHSDGLGSTVVVMFTSSPRQDDKDRAFQWDFVQAFIVKGEFETPELDALLSQYGQQYAA